MVNKLIDRTARANELSKKITDMFSEIKEEGFEIWVCERDDADAISVPTNVEYNIGDDRIYINAEYIKVDWAKGNIF